MLIEAIFSIGTFIIKEVVRVAAKQLVPVWLDSLRRTNLANRNEHSSCTHNTAKNSLSELEVIDAEFVDLERKQQRDGYASHQDRERREELESSRVQKFEDYQKAKKEEIVKEQFENPENYKTSALKNDSVHVLQYHMGQVVLEKKCKESGCRKPMILNSKQRFDGSLYCLNDFFWSCTGFYSRSPLQCKATQRFQAADIGFLHKSDVFEFQISNQDLSSFFSESSVKKATVDRVESHLKEKDDEVLCSTHHVPMILREKREHQGIALDMFFLSCPHPGCQQLVKLKSPAQLAAYLKRREGRGIL